MWPFKRKLRNTFFNIGTPYVHPDQIASAVLDYYGEQANCPRGTVKMRWWFFTLDRKETDAEYKTRLGPVLSARYRMPTPVEVGEHALETLKNYQIGEEDALKQRVIEHINPEFDYPNDRWGSNEAVPNPDYDPNMTYTQAVALIEKRRLARLAIQQQADSVVADAVQVR